MSEKATLVPIVMEQANRSVPSDSRAIETMIPGPTFSNLEMQSFGSVAKLGSALAKRSLPDSLTFICDNSAGLVAETYVLFDEYGLVTAGRTLGAITQDGGTYAATKKSTAANTILFKGINYRILAGDPNDFRQMKIVDKDIDGSDQGSVPVRYAQNKRDSAFSDVIATVEKLFAIDGYKGIEITLPAGQKAAFDFFVAGINRIQ